MTSPSCSRYEVVGWMAAVKCCWYIPVKVMEAPRYCKYVVLHGMEVPSYKRCIVLDVIVVPKMLQNQFFGRHEGSASVYILDFGGIGGYRVCKSDALVGWGFQHIVNLLFWIVCKFQHIVRATP